MCAKRKEIELVSDQAIRSSKEDKFDRADFVKAIAEVIHSQTTQVNPDNNPEFKDIDENMIIGLYGSWGFGKSSVMLMLDEQLRKESVQTAFFNPWMYNSEEHLIISLFNTIVELSGLTGDSKDDLIKLIQKYQPLISLASSSAGKIGEAISKIGDNEVNLNAVVCKDRIDKLLLGNANPVVIFIDDVDRLSKQEIHVLFKTLRLIASFKNIIYVVAFDFDMVSKSIKENYADGSIEDGKAFIEKIIQIPIRIPDLSKDELFNFGVSLIQETTSTDMGLHPVFKALYAEYMFTPRDVKRFINGLRFTHHYLRDLLPVQELICLELIRSKNHLMFGFIRLYANAIKSSDPSGKYHKETNEYFHKNNSGLVTDKFVWNNNHKEFHLYQMVMTKLFGMTGIEGSFRIPKQGTVNLTQFIKLTNGKENKGLQNPWAIVEYFEKCSNDEVTPDSSNQSVS